MAAHRWTFLLLSTGLAICLFCFGGFIPRGITMFVPAMVALLHLIGLVALTVHLHRVREYAPISTPLSAFAILCWGGITVALIIADHETRTGVPLAQSKVFGYDIIFGFFGVPSFVLSMIGLLHAEWKAARKLAAAPR